MVTAYSNILPQMKGVNYENTIIVLSKYVDDRFEKLFLLKGCLYFFYKNPHVTRILIVTIVFQVYTLHVEGPNNIIQSKTEVSY